MPKCFSKERRIAKLVRRSERGSSIYPIPRSHESHSYKVAPMVPPLPKFARMRKPASAMKKTAMTPRIASVLIRGSASFSSLFRRFFLSFRFPCLIGIHHTLEEGILHRNFFSHEVSVSLFPTRRALFGTMIIPFCGTSLVSLLRTFLRPRLNAHECSLRFSPSFI